MQNTINQEEIIQRQQSKVIEIIPERYKNVDFKDVPKNVADFFQKIKESRKGIYIYGSVGTGKTHILYALFKELSKKGISGKFQNVTEMFRSFREEFDRPYQAKERPEQKLIDFRGVLFLDDLGAEKISEWVEETLYLIINHRYNQMLPTIISSNLSLSDLSKRIGDRTASRIAEMCDVVKLEGKDRRI